MILYQIKSMEHTLQNISRSGNKFLKSLKYVLALEDR